jgi:hypothetical protein
LAREARLCVACGYDRKTGKARQTKHVVAGPSLAGVAKSVGSFGLGILLSSLGAGIAAFIWAVVAVKWHWELGFIAWGVGLLAGGGMYLGYRSHNVLAGVVAAGISVFGIVLAKVFIFAFWLSGTFVDTADLEREMIIGYVTEEVLDERGAFDEVEREEQWESAYEEASDRVSAMSDEELTELQEFYDRLDDERIWTLADHYSTVRAMRQGLPRYDPLEFKFYREEQRRLAGMTDVELDAAMEEYQAWLEGGKWEDPDDARIFLTYYLVEQTIDALAEAQPTRFEYPDAERWKKLYEEKAAEIEAMSPEDRQALIEEAKTKEQESASAYESIDAEQALEQISQEVGVTTWLAVLGLFFFALFGFFDIIWLVLAVTSAYKVATGVISADSD